MQNISLILSVLGAFLGVASFYLTQLRPPRIQVIAERRIRIGYALEGSAFGAYVPLTFVNRSQRLGVVHKITLVLQAREANEPAFCIDLSRFTDLDPGKNSYRDIALPHSFAVPGNSSVSHLVKFMWWNDSKPGFILGTKSYDFTILVWTRPKVKPDAVARHVLHPTETQAAILDASRKAGDGVNIEVVLDQGSPGNRILNQKDLQREFGELFTVSTSTAGPQATMIPPMASSREDSTPTAPIRTRQKG